MLSQASDSLKQRAEVPERTVESTAVILCGDIKPPTWKEDVVTFYYVELSPPPVWLYLKKKILTCASGDNKLLQTQVYVQVILEDWKLEREKRNK